MTVIAIFGGSFDPVHTGHLGLAREVLNAGLADEIMFLPAAHAPHKLDRPATAPKIRLAMLNAILEPGFAYCTYEIERNEVATSYSYQTMRTLNYAFSHVQLKFLMGMDSLRGLHTWREAAALVRENEFIIYERPGQDRPSLEELIEQFSRLSPTDAPHFAEKLLNSIVTLPEFSISSTGVREAVKNGLNLDSLVPPAVQKIITKHKLYGATV